MSDFRAITICSIIAVMMVVIACTALHFEDNRHMADRGYERGVLPGNPGTHWVKVREAKHFSGDCGEAQQHAHE